jgi:cytochrome c oxidase subunit 2
MQPPIILQSAALLATIGLALAQPARRAAASTPIHVIDVAARKFQFAPASIAVSAGELVRLTIHSDDVVHGFAIPQLNIDVRIPSGGDAVTIEFVAPAPGQYEIVCSKFCGHGHDDMRALLVSRSAEVLGASAR